MFMIFRWSMAHLLSNCHFSQTPLLHLCVQELELEMEMEGPSLTHFTLIFHFCTPKTSENLRFLEGIDMEYWREMD